MLISLIAAMSQNRVIGINNELPWHLPADLKHFKNTTLNKPIIMGRKTFDSVGSALPKRQNIVVTRNKDFQAENIEVADSIETAISIAKQSQPDEIMIVGGGQIYQQALAFADRIYLTVVAKDYQGDAYFPEFSKQEFKQIDCIAHPAENNQPAFEILTFERTNV